MKREDKERQDRLQRMLAREQGVAPPDERLSEGARSPADVPPAGFEPPPETAARASRPAPEPAAKPEEKNRTNPAGDTAGSPAPETRRTPEPKSAPDATAEYSNLQRLDFSRRPKKRRRPLSPILRRRRRRRQLMLLALVLAVGLLFAWVSGALSRTMTAARDLADTIAISFEPGSWPASSVISEPVQVQELAGGLVELGNTDVAVYSASGALLRTIQPGYARPAIETGGTRFVLYNRAGNELRIESRTRTLATQTLDSAILLCAMSQNGTVGVVTESSRFAACVQVLDPTAYAVQYEWYATEADGTPVALDFAPDSRRFAAGCISASAGQVLSRIYMMDTGSDEAGPVYTAQPGEMILKLQWLDTNRVLAVFDDCLVLLDASTATEVARYDYGGASLVDLDIADHGIALLLAGQGNAALSVLDTSLNQISSTDAGNASRVCCTSTSVYLTGGSWVRCLYYDGTEKWQNTLETPASALLSADQPLIFTGTQISVMAG